MSHISTLVVQCNIEDADALPEELEKTAKILRDNLQTDHVIDVTLCIRERASAIIAALDPFAKTTCPLGGPHYIEPLEE